MEILAIIPARGNSIEIKNKNLRKIGGIPLIGNTIQIAKKSKLVNRIMVSTDSNKIGLIAKKFGSEFIKRPDKISGGNSKSEETVLHVIDFLIKHENYLPDYVVFLQCTSPLIDGVDIDNIIKKTIKSQADSAFTVTEFSRFIWNYKKGKLTALNYNPNNRLMRQKVETQFLEVGAIYVFRTKGFLLSKNRIFGKTVHYLLPSYNAIEIDSMFDLELCRILFKKLQLNKKKGILPNKNQNLKTQK